MHLAAVFPKDDGEHHDHVNIAVDCVDRVADGGVLVARYHRGLQLKG